MTGLDKIKNNIDSIAPVTTDEWEFIEGVIEKVSIKKNDIFLKEKSICDFLAFVDSGVLVYYKTLDNADEITTDFAFEGEWVTNNHSRLNNSPSHLNIKAIEDSELFIVKHSHLISLYDKVPAMERFSRILMEQAFVKLIQLSIDLQTLSGTERYLKLLQSYPAIFRKVPLYHIANYLGIAPKSLSRIRNSIFYPGK